MSVIVGGKRFEIDGVRTLAAHEAGWNKLVRGNKRTRRLRCGVAHKINAENTERIVDGVLKSTDGWGDASNTVRYWYERKDKSGKPAPVSGTQFVVGEDGSIVQTEDPVVFVGWHGHTANETSFGYEMRETLDGQVERTTLEAAIALELFISDTCRIQRQQPHAYKGKPLERFRERRDATRPWGENVVGFLGHRDTAWDIHGGHWSIERDANDPGDAIGALRDREGFERFDFGAREDLDVWMGRQTWLAKEGYYHGEIDGVPLDQTCDALEACGFPNGVYANWRQLAEKPALVLDVA